MLSAMWGMSPWMWILLLPAGFLLLLFIVAVKERRLAQPYVPARQWGPPPLPRAGPAIGTSGGSGPLRLEYNDNLPDPTQVSHYVAAMSAELARSGFEFGGIIAHAKAPSIQILAALWWSPARDVLVLTGSGTVLKMAAKQTWLLTPLDDARLLVTTDNNDEGDFSRMYILKRRINMPMSDLLAVHRRRIENAAGHTRRFTEPTPLDALQALYDRRVERMVQRGVARWVDAHRTAWHYTALGGLLVCLDFFRQFIGVLPQFWRVNRAAIASTHLMPPGTGLMPTKPAESMRDDAHVVAR